MKRVARFCFEKGIIVNQTTLKRDAVEVASRRLLGELIICRNISAAGPREGPGAADPHPRLETKSMYRARFQQMGW